MSLRLITLGPPRAWNGDEELVDLPSQRLRFALLVYLAVEGGATRESVLSLFWPDRDPARARHALRQMLYELRQLLGEAWIDVGRDRVTVHANVDLAEFERAAAAARNDEALAVYGGAFLQGFYLDNAAFDGWVDRRRAQLGRTHRRVCGAHIDHLLSAGRTADALRQAQQWVELDPLEDEANHALIRCLAAAGQRLEALQHFESYERQLAAELQVEPLDETRALVEQIRSGDVAPAPAPVVPVSMPLPGAPVPAQHAPDSASASNAAPAAAPPPAVAAAPEPGAGPVLSHHAAAPRPRAPGRFGGRPLLAAAAAAVIVLIGALGYRAERPRAAAAAPSARVMVLPFSDRSDDSTMVSLAGALTESLARNLAQSRPLDVVSPTGVALLRERGVSDDSLRRLQRADYLVSGSVFASADSVRVAIELLDGQTGSVMRSELIERARAESRILVEDVIERTAGFLRREVGNQVEVRRVRASTASEEAWRSVLEARTQMDALTLLVRYRDYAAVDRAISRADSLLARAGELDRRWAEPFVMRGWLMERRAFISNFAAPGDTASRRKLLEAGRSMADRAIERDRNEPRAYELRGTILHQLAVLPGLPHDTAQARFEQAVAELNRATELGPQSPSSWRRLAELLNTGGRYAAAKSAADRAWTIDRYVNEANSVVNLLFATSLELGDDAEADRWCAEGRRTFPHQLPFVYCLFALNAWGDLRPPDLPLLHQELAAYRKSHTTLQPELVARFETLLAAAHVRDGQQDSARAILRRTARVDDAGVRWMRAGVLAMLGDHDAAMQDLKAYVAPGGWERLRVARSRPFRTLQGRPDYDQLVGS